MRVTDFNGYYLSVYPSGEHELEITHDGYKLNIAKFRVQEGLMTRKDILLGMGSYKKGIFCSGLAPSIQQCRVLYQSVHYLALVHYKLPSSEEAGFWHRC